MSHSERTSGWVFRVPSTEGQTHADALISDKLVLIADDSPFIRRSCSTILRKSGFGTVEASHGSEALASYQEHRPDVVLLDLRVPERGGLSGASAKFMRYMGGVPRQPDGGACGADVGPRRTDGDGRSSRWWRRRRP